jgi:hypothetical protein
MQEITFDTLPLAVKHIFDELRLINQKIDGIKTPPEQTSDSNKYVDINQIRVLVFPQWKKQTIYNKCHLGELPHSRIGSRLLFDLEECRQWRDQKIQQGKIKSKAQIKIEAQEFFNKHRKEKAIP